MDRKLRANARTWSRLGTTIAACCLALSAFAQDEAVGPQVETFQPLPDQHGNTLSVSGVATTGDLRFATNAFMYTNIEPVSVLLDEGESIPLIDKRHMLDFGFALGLSDYFELGMSIPIVLIDDVNAVAAIGFPNPNSFSAPDSLLCFGDIRMYAKGDFGLRESLGGVGLGALIQGELGTDNSEPFGPTPARVEFRLNADYTEVFTGLTFAANLGFVVQSEPGVFLSVQQDDAFRWGLAVRGEVPWVVGLEAMVTAYGAVQLTDNLDIQDLSQTSSDMLTSPAELQAALRYAHESGLGFNLGLGVGLNEAFGSPAFRLMAGFGYTDIPVDTDGDGIFDDDDECMSSPEDPDNFEDWDGCPDLDDDSDGVLDGSDQCPRDAEDVDGFEDEDGCPDYDNDGDGFADHVDRCPLEAEDEDGFEDTDGCPDLDDDGDTVPDTEDACPDQVEDLDGFEDDDGCPELDNDGDGLDDDTDACPNVAEDKDGHRDADGCPDVDNDDDGLCDPWVAASGLSTDACFDTDACPDEAEIINGTDDADGCPDEGTARVAFKGSHIELLEPLEFERNGAELRKKSAPVLDQVAAVLRNRPGLRVRIESHLNQEIGASETEPLTKARANAVKDALIQRGVAAERLTAVGFSGERMGADAKKGAQVIRILLR